MLFVSLLLLWPSYITHASPNNLATSRPWHTLQALNQPRQEHSVVALEDKIYVLGGTAAFGPPPDGKIDTVNTVESYSLSTNTWHDSKPFLQPLNHLNAAAADGKIYVFGGLAVNNETGSWDASGVSMVYTPSRDEWEDVETMPERTERGACAVGVYGSKIYLAGGMTYLNKEQDVNDVVTCYDTVTGTWDTGLPALPQPRQHVSGAVVGSVFYVLGGRTNGQLKIQSSVFALDLDRVADGWREVASMPTARGGLACAAVGELIYCLGGEGNPDSKSGVFAQVEVYDTRIDQWRRVDDMPVPRHGWGVAAIGDTIYVPGGGVSAGTDPTDLFDAFTP